MHRQYNVENKQRQTRQTINKERLAMCAAAAATHTHTHTHAHTHSWGAVSGRGHQGAVRPVQTTALSHILIIVYE